MGKFRSTQFVNAPLFESYNCLLNGMSTAIDTATGDPNFCMITCECFHFVFLCFFHWNRYDKSGKIRAQSQYIFMTFKMTHFIHGQNEIAKTLPNKRNSAIIFLHIEMNIDKKTSLDN